MEYTNVGEMARRGRPRMPRSYGVPEGEEGMLSWDHVVDRMAQSRNYWLSTVRPDGRPHAVPVWGVWMDDTLHFGGGGTTRKAKNLGSNTNVAVHTESGEEVAILEGVAEEVADPPLLERIDDAYEEKYGIRHGTPVWAVRPAVVLAWSGFPTDATRWIFSSEGHTDG